MPSAPQSAGGLGTLEAEDRSSKVHVCGKEGTRRARRVALATSVLRGFIYFLRVGILGADLNRTCISSRCEYNGFRGGHPVSFTSLGFVRL